MYVHSFTLHYSTAFVLLFVTHVFFSLILGYNNQNNQRKSEFNLDRLCMQHTHAHIYKYIHIHVQTFIHTGIGTASIRICEARIK